MLPAGQLASQSRAVSCPAASPHALLDTIPNALHDLSVPPPALISACPLINTHRQDASAQTHNIIRRLLVAPSNVKAGIVSEQLGRVAVLVRLELPGLAGGEDGDDARPVGGLESRGAVDEDEGHGRAGNRGHHALDLQHVGR